MKILHHLIKCATTTNVFVTIHLLLLWTAPSLVAPYWLKETVSNLVDGSKLWFPPELNNVLGERHQLPLEGWDQGCLLLQGKGKQVVVMVAKPKKVVLGVVAIKKLTF